MILECNAESVGAESARRAVPSTVTRPAVGSRAPTEPQNGALSAS